jgi:hypothetical protein
MHGTLGMVFHGGVTNLRTFLFVLFICTACIGDRMECRIMVINKSGHPIYFGYAFTDNLSNIDRFVTEFISNQEVIKINPKIPQPNNLFKQDSTTICTIPWLEEHWKSKYNGIYFYIFDLDSLDRYYKVDKLNYYRKCKKVFFTKESLIKTNLHAFLTEL